MSDQAAVSLTLTLALLGIGFLWALLRLGSALSRIADKGSSLAYIGDKLDDIARKTGTGKDDKVPSTDAAS